MVVLDSSEQAFVLEEISPSLIARKREIARVLENLAKNGLKRVHPCRPNRQAAIMAEHAGRYWQLRDYLPGAFLPRPEYLDEPWRGRELGAFLIALHDTSAKAQITFTEGPFSIVHFIEDFVKKLEIYRPDLIEEIYPVLDFLSGDFFQTHDNLPQAFCHGDYHPLNVVWSADSILSVIDWEFCGVKPEAYDLALLIGCVGVEDPQALTGPLVRSLLRRIREGGIYAGQSWKMLPELVMALRFAWLSEWLRKDDLEMVRLELDYLNLLLVNRSVLISVWR
jgi:homoserine kinase type II